MITQPQLLDALDQACLQNFMKVVGNQLSFATNDKTMDEGLDNLARQLDLLHEFNKRAASVIGDADAFRPIG
ncbi:hypothetical protein AAFX91_14240 [Bradyrhizobium sp. 31Argb]|uniref:hypothetical protein n=1 Tax=Bradyrhizobium sp. 31Argb TaxID=3141247 RepID=UPI003747C7D8